MTEWARQFNFVESIDPETNTLVINEKILDKYMAGEHMFLTESQHGYPPHCHFSNNATLGDIIRDPNTGWLFYGIVVTGFSSSTMPYRAWYSPSKNTLITAQYKSGTRSVNRFVESYGKYKFDWRTITTPAAKTNLTI